MSASLLARLKYLGVIPDNTSATDAVAEALGAQYSLRPLKADEVKWYTSSDKMTVEPTPDQRYQRFRDGDGNYAPYYAYTVCTRCNRKWLDHSHSYCFKASGRYSTFSALDRGCACTNCGKMWSQHSDHFCLREHHQAYVSGSRP